MKKSVISISYLDLKWIIIAAKDSNDLKTERRIRGTIAHELCHYAIQLVFKNALKPYFNSKNRNLQLLYQEIIRNLYRWLKMQPTDEYGNYIDQCDDIIQLSLTYFGHTSNDLIPLAVEQDLIVKVVEILAYYHDDETKVRELENIFAPLFDFYANHVNPEFMKFNYEQQRVLTSFNEKTGVLRELKKLMYIGNSQYIEMSSSKNLSSILSKKVTIITTNIRKLFLYDLYNTIHPKSPDLFETENIMICAESLIKLDSQEENKTLIDFEDVLAKIPKLNVFIDCSKIADINPVWHNFSKTANFIYIVDNQSYCNKLLTLKILRGANKMQFNYKWNDLTAKSQQLLLQIKSNFDCSSKFSLQQILSQKSDEHGKANNLFISDVMDSGLLKFLLEDQKNRSTDEILISGDYHMLYEKRYFKRKIKVFEENKYIQSNDDISEDVDQVIDDGDVANIGEVLESSPNRNSSKLSIDKLLEETSNLKFIIIRDTFGSGSTWALKSIADVFKNQDSPKWVSYIDLSQMIPSIKSELRKKVPGVELIPDFLAFISNHVLKTKQEFEIKIFMKMYQMGKVVILFDAFNELARIFAEYFLQLVKVFKHNGGNQLWIVTKDDYEINLQKELGLEIIYALDDFSKDDGVEVMAKIWALNDMKQMNYQVNSKDDFLENFNKLDEFENYRERARNLIESSEVALVQDYKNLAEMNKDRNHQVYIQRTANENGELSKEVTIVDQRQEVR